MSINASTNIILTDKNAESTAKGEEACESFQNSVSVTSYPLVQDIGLSARRQSPVSRAVLSTYDWAQSDTVRAMLGLLDIRKIAKRVINGVSYFIKAIAYDDGNAPQRRLPSGESFDYKAVVEEPAAEYEEDFGLFLDDFLCSKESKLVPYVANDVSPNELAKYLHENEASIPPYTLYEIVMNLVALLFLILITVVAVYAVHDLPDVTERPIELCNIEGPVLIDTGAINDEEGFKAIECGPSKDRCDDRSVDTPCDEPTVLLTEGPIGLELDLGEPFALDLELGLLVERFEAQKSVSGNCSPAKPDCSRDEATETCAPAIEEQDRESSSPMEGFQDDLEECIKEECEEDCEGASSDLQYGLPRSDPQLFGSSNLASSSSEENLSGSASSPMEPNWDCICNGAKQYKPTSLLAEDDDFVTCRTTLPSWNKMTGEEHRVSIEANEQKPLHERVWIRGFRQYGPPLEDNCNLRQLIPEFEIPDSETSISDLIVILVPLSKQSPPAENSPQANREFISESSTAIDNFMDFLNIVQWDVERTRNNLSLLLPLPPVKGYWKRECPDQMIRMIDELNSSVELIKHAVRYTVLQNDKATSTGFFGRPLNPSSTIALTEEAAKRTASLCAFRDTTAWEILVSYGYYLELIEDYALVLEGDMVREKKTAQS